MPPEPVGWLLLAAAVLLGPLPLITAPRRPRIPESPGTRRRRKSEAQQAALAWVLAVAGELRAGCDPMVAVARSSARIPTAPQAGRAARLGGDVAAALRSDAVESGAAVLASVAGVWELARSTGVGVSDILENLADGYRRSLSVQQTLAVEVAAPRATARMMTLLPVVGIGFAAMMGADPLGWLLTTPLGLLTLAAGVGCNAAGYWWIRRILAGVSESL